MADEVPGGAAVFPEIPAELGVSPLFLATLHAVVFLAGSERSVVEPAAADEALGVMAEYLSRLTGSERRRVKEDLTALRLFAKGENWPKQLTTFLKSFPADFGIDTKD